MLVDHFVALAVILGVVSLYWVLHGLVLFPVKAGENTRLSIVLDLNGEAKDLEHTLKGLIWLRENGTIKADIELRAATPDNSTRLVGMAFSKDYHFITYTETGES